jgi:hypothetical protein
MAHRKYGPFVARFPIGARRTAYTVPVRLWERYAYLVQRQYSRSDAGLSAARRSIHCSVIK